MFAKTENILVVEDFDPMLKTIKHALENQGYANIHTATNGQEAWDKLLRHHYALVISDLSMPVMNGQKLLEMIRASAEHKNLPFIMLTADGEREMVLAAAKAGVTEFVLKPFSPSGLHEKVQAAFAKHSPVLRSRAPELSSKQPVVDESGKIERKPIAGTETVLVVDDDANSIDLLVNLLKNKYRVKATRKGTHALQLANDTHPPDLILLDIMMPEMDGYAVCRELKNNIETANIPVIFLSSKDSVADITKGFSLGAVDYVTKPIEPEILLARVNTHLSLRRSHKLLAEQIDTLLENARIKEDVERITRHDIKNPISAIVSELQCMIEAPDTSSSDKEKLESLRHSAHMALNMITGSLDLFKMDTGTYKFEPETVELIPVLKQVIKDLRAERETHKVITELHPFTEQATVTGEEALCYSLFFNLVKNAVEASPKQGVVKVALEQHDQELAIRIYNDGIIDPAIRDKLFDKYVSANKKSGNGLGTYSAKMMTLMQQGHIEFQTLDEKSTVFTVLLKRP